MDIELQTEVTRDISYFRKTLPKGASRTVRTVVRRSRTLILRLRKNWIIFVAIQNIYMHLSRDRHPKHKLT